VLTRARILWRSLFDAKTRRGRLLRVIALVAPFALAGRFGVPTCPWALVTGRPCPGCGMTRAAGALAHGDVAAAITMNPTAPLTVPVSAAVVFFFLAAYVYDGNSRVNATLPRAAALATIAVLYAVWIARAFGAFGGPVPV
jgi:hypothetical protein